MSDSRYALAQPARHEVRIRKSRFLAQAAPVADEQAAMACLASVSEATANHNCWAWRIGQRYRFSDDGEPGGSAGKPILSAIDGQEFDQVVVVVSRWFGGIKLGIGGLMRAYGGSAAECLRQAPRRPIVAMATVEFELGYAPAERLRAHLDGWNHQVLAEDYGAERVHMRLQLAQRHLAELETLLGDLSRGQACLHVHHDTPTG